MRNSWVRPARYRPEKPAETYIEHMIRMSWIEADGAGGLRLAPLGRALLRNDAFSRQAEDAPSVVVLEADSPLSYGSWSAISPGVVRLS